MGNSDPPSRQPPMDAPGTAVLYIRGFSYTSKAPCSCAKPELLATTSGGSNARLDLSRLPQELQLAGGVTLLPATRRGPCEAEGRAPAAARRCRCAAL